MKYLSIPILTLLINCSTKVDTNSLREKHRKLIQEQKIQYVTGYAYDCVSDTTSVKQVQEYTIYNRDGLTLETKIYYGSTLSRHTKHQYNDQYQLVRTDMVLGHYYKVYTRGSDGKIIQTDSYDSTDVLYQIEKLTHTDTSRITISYTPEGKPTDTSIVKTDGHGNIISFRGTEMTYTYNEEGYPILRTTTYVSSDEVHTTEYIYSPDDLLQKTIWSVDGVPKSCTLYKYSRFKD